jgi:hypothetical protein
MISSADIFTQVNLDMESPQVVPGRECGSCMMCCKTPSIRDPELDKPPGQWCPYAVSGRGCGIYKSRPVTCRRFYCQWMLDARLGPEWKPEKSKFVMYLGGSGQDLNVAVDPAFPNAWMRPPFLATITSWAKEGAEPGRFVLVRIGPRLIAILPDRTVDLGKVDSDARLGFSRKPGPAGFQYSIEVAPASATRVSDQSCR